MHILNLVEPFPTSGMYQSRWFMVETCSNRGFRELQVKEILFLIHQSCSLF